MGFIKNVKCLDIYIYRFNGDKKVIDTIRHKRNQIKQFNSTEGLEEAE